MRITRKEAFSPPVEPLFRSSHLSEVPYPDKEKLQTTKFKLCWFWFHV